jgi:hypothetical protein
MNFFPIKKHWALFVQRACVDRLVSDDRHTIAKEMEEVKIQGLHLVEVRDKNPMRQKNICDMNSRFF